MIIIGCSAFLAWDVTQNGGQWYWALHAMLRDVGLL